MTRITITADGRCYYTSKSVMIRTDEEIDWEINHAIKKRPGVEYIVKIETERGKREIKL